MAVTAMNTWTITVHRAENMQSSSALGVDEDYNFTSAYNAVNIAMGCASAQPTNPNQT